MPRGIHGVRQVKAYLADDGKVYIDYDAAVRAARKSEFERRIRSWIEKAFKSPGSRFMLERAMLSHEGAAALNEAFKLYRKNGNGGVQHVRRRRKSQSKNENGVS